MMNDQLHKMIYLCFLLNGSGMQDWVKYDGRGIFTLAVLLDMA